MKLRALRLEASTQNGPYGVGLSFDDGLNILRAGNSSGKSTCVQAIVYALGLEGMISKTHSVPLPHCMTERLEDGGREYVVIESWVMLEIQNSKGEILTLRRPARSNTQDIHLISTWDGPALTDRNHTFVQHDYFVRYPGAASRERGFHSRLATFLDWKLPTVQRYDGDEGPLYLECIFPLMIVEQKHGWSGIQASIPVHYGIREVGKRSTEFVLALDAYNNALKRQTLLADKEKLRTQWSDSVRECEDLARASGSVWQGLSREPTTDWPPSIPPAVLCFDGEKWIALREERARYQRLLAEFHEVPVPNVGSSVDGVRNSLERTYEQLRTNEILTARLLNDVQAERAELEALELRIQALREDLLRHQDLERLKGLGSTEALEISRGLCPTCHQSVRESLFPQDQEQVVMSVDQNIEFIQGQLATFENMREDAVAVLTSKEQEVAGLRTAADQFRSQIRSYRSTLISPDQLPSVSELRRRIQIEERAQQLRKFEDDIAGLLDRLGSLAQNWKRVLDNLATLPEDDLSDQDKTKLQNLQGILLDQLRGYGFSSVPPGSISISTNTYKPVHEDGFDLGFDLSATDMIRLIWSYLLGLLELGRQSNLNHPGFVIFDEPRQHEMERSSYEQFLRRAALARQFNQQIFVTTSEEEQRLAAMLQSIPANYTAFPSKILTSLRSKG